MPITPAHAAAVVPLSCCRKSMLLSPLVVGSMSPDFAYFLSFPLAYRHFGHTPPGLIFFCIPAGLAVLWVFHNVLKRPLVLLMPKPLRARLWPYCAPFPILPEWIVDSLGPQTCSTNPRAVSELDDDTLVTDKSHPSVEGSWKRLLWICTLIVLGAITHVAWDSFTHDNGWVVAQFPLMRAIVDTGLAPISVFSLLQWLSSVLGLALLAWWSWRWYRTAPKFACPSEPFLAAHWRVGIVSAIVLFTIGIGAAGGVARALQFSGRAAIKEFCAASFITGMDACVLSLLVFAWYARVRLEGTAEILARYGMASQAEDSPLCG